MMQGKVDPEGLLVELFEMLVVPASATRARQHAETDFPREVDEILGRAGLAGSRCMFVESPRTIED